MHLVALILLLAIGLTVTIGGVQRGQYLLAPNEQRREFYDLNSGPVVVSSDGQPIIAALLDVWLQPGSNMVTSYAQTMGLPKELLSDTYYFPAYDNVTVNGQLRFGNVGTNPTTVTVPAGMMAGLFGGAIPVLGRRKA